MSPDEGLLIQRYYNSLEAANGKWIWKMSDIYPTRYMVDSINNGRYTNIFFYDRPNRIFGETIINLDNKPAVDIHTNLPFLKNKNQSSSNGDSNTCFDIGYNQVYSPWSNPGSIIETQSDSVVVEITGKTKLGNLIVNIYFNNLTESTPAKPQKLQVSRQYMSNPNYAYHPILNWYRNLEPDFQKYYIYRSQVYTPGVDPSYYYLIGETTDSVFLDESLTLYRSGGGAEPCEYVLKQFYYKISALDLTNKESVKSDRDSISGYLDPCQSWIPPGGSDNYKIINNLYQNFPNPFNPKTSIRYSLSENNFVNITIYDILGRVVKTLVNEYKLSGEYLVDYDGSSLASGIYFYKMKTNNYSSIKRLLIIK
jgi:hypothetical protein